jgi:hypothetical protein
MRNKSPFQRQKTPFQRQKTPVLFFPPAQLRTIRNKERMTKPRSHSRVAKRVWMALIALELYSKVGDGMRRDEVAYRVGVKASTFH